MPNSKSCLSCGLAVVDDAEISFCPSCLRPTQQSAQEKTLEEEISLFGPPTATHLLGRPQALETPESPAIPGGGSPPPSDPASYSTAERAKISELARRGYRVLRKLGEGGFGVVFLAFDSAERLVAIKMLHDGLGQERYRQRFALEAKALTRLDHPNLVRLHHYDIAGREPILVTEFVPGGTLSERLRACPAFSVAQAVDSIVHLAEAVQFVHDQQLIHRDIKPSNILIGADGHLKLGDFGLAKRLDREDDLTLTGRGIGGTPEYSAPEQFRGSGECDARADIYALGATFYRLLTGVPLFERDENPDFVGAILRMHTEEPKPPRAVRPEIPRELEAVCLKCLAKHPADRYATAADLAADLRAWRDTGRAKLARPRSLAARAVRSLRPWPKFPVAMILVALLGVGATSFFWDKGEPLRPVDPLIAMKQEMEKDGKLVLMGDDGLPRWHRFALGAPELQKAKRGGHGCQLESIDCCVLELFPEIPWSHFRCTAELRVMDSRMGADPTINPGICFFVGGQQSVSPGHETVSVYTMAGIRYSEGPLAVSVNSHFQAVAISLAPHPDARTHTSIAGLGQLPFTPSATLPAPWRTLELEVGPGDHLRPRAIFGTTPQDLGIGIRGGVLDPPSLIKEFDFQAEYLHRLPLYADLVFPKWNPRGAVGFWGDKAAFEFRNVVLTALP